MLLHQLGKDVVLDAELVLQGGDLAVLAILRGFATFAVVFEGRGAVLEELLLPQVEEVDREVVLLANVGDRLLLQEMESEQGDLLFRREVPTLASHGRSSARVLPLTPAKASSSSE